MLCRYTYTTCWCTHNMTSVSGNGHKKDNMVPLPPDLPIQGGIKLCCLNPHAQDLQATNISFRLHNSIYYTCTRRYLYFVFLQVDFIIVLGVVFPCCATVVASYRNLRMVMWLFCLSCSRLLSASSLNVRSVRCNYSSSNLCEKLYDGATSELIEMYFTKLVVGHSDLTWW